MLNFLFSRTPVFYLIQSVWRDEAFSYFMAKPNIIQIIINTANDFNPPLYYLLLHFWMKISNHSDEALRMLSFFFHLVTVYFFFLFANKLYHKKYAYFIALFTFLNPMLLYYAFEIRMYSLFACLTISTLYFFFTKKWKWYTVFAVLGLYTHSFFSLVIMSLAAVTQVSQQLRKNNLILIFKPFLFFIPWLPVLLIQFLHSKDSWIFPVDLQLIKSVLGNLFTNYEGTPGNWWPFTALLSGVIILFFIFAYQKDRKRSLLFLFPIFFTLIPVLGYSILRRPIYVNRYLIFITIFEIMGIGLGIWNITNRLVRYFTMTAWIIFLVYFNLSISPYHKKTDFKSLFWEINKIAKPQNNYVYTKTPIAYLESAYYYRFSDKVFVYNPQNISIPYYIGMTLVFPNVSRPSFPAAPSKTFLISDDADYELVINQ